MQRFSLLGITKHVITIDSRYYTRAAKAFSKFRTRITAQNAQLPGLERFPAPVQVLLLPELQQGQRRAEDGETLDNRITLDGITSTEDPDGFDWINAACTCRFYRRWILPCQHLFQHHFTNFEQTLAPHRLEFWSRMWEEHGFELYEASESYYAPKLAEKEDITASAAAANRLAGREVTEALLANMYEFQMRLLANPLLSEEARCSAIAEYILRLRGAAARLETFTKSRLDELQLDCWKQK